MNDRRSTRYHRATNVRVTDARHRPTGCQAGPTQITNSPHRPPARARALPAGPQGIANTPGPPDPNHPPGRLRTTATAPRARPLADALLPSQQAFEARATFGSVPARGERLRDGCSSDRIADIRRLLTLRRGTKRDTQTSTDARHVPTRFAALSAQPGDTSGRGRSQVASARHLVGHADAIGGGRTPRHRST